MASFSSGDPVARRHAAALDFLYGRINYESALRMPYGAGVFRLDRMRRLLAEVGSPHEHLPVVHIAGTKGKGSTAAMTAAVLKASGRKTGLFSSPHLFRLEERLAIDGQSCPSEELSTLVELVRPAVERADALGDSDDPQGLTYFEVLTAMAFLHFARQKVDAAVLEVGLGGRLDSTNVCLPRVAAITSISFDHTKQLGNTLDLIAREKAGIVKAGVPTVSGVREAEARAAIVEICRERKSPLIERGVHFDASYRVPRHLEQSSHAASVDLHYDEGGTRLELNDIELGLLGEHQAANAAVCLASVVQLRRRGWEIDDTALRRGLAEVHWPARVEVVSRQPTVVIDAAHNLASIEALVRVLDESFVARRRVLVFATSHDKDAAGMLRILLPRFDEVILTRFLHNPRAVAPEELAALATDCEGARCTVAADPAEAWRRARAAVDTTDLLCVTGSFFIAAEMRASIEGRSVQAAISRAAVQ